MSKIKQTFNVIKMKTKKHAPTILAAVGTVGVVASTVMACKATLKLDEVLEETKDTINKIHEASENTELIESGKYTEEDMSKDLTIAYTQGGVKLVKLYGPSVILGTLSLTCLIGSNYMLTKRNANLTAALATTFSGFQTYRNNVKERFGEETDFEMLHSIKTVQEEIVNADTGEVEIVEKKVMPDNLEVRDTSRLFDVGNPNWTKVPAANRMYLEAAQSWFNDQLRIKKYIFLNEVYEYLGFERTKEGQVLGWKYDLNDNSLSNYISFDLDNAANAGFGDYERSVWLNFNVDGNVWELMA